MKNLVIKKTQLRYNSLEPPTVFGEFGAGEVEFDQTDKDDRRGSAASGEVLYPVVQRFAGNWCLCTAFGKLTYFVDYRNKTGIRRRLTIGRHGKLTIATMGEVVKGEDPAEERATQRKSMTVKELCTRYMAATEKGLIMGKRNRPKKASTLYVDQGRIARHILPLLGNKRVCSIGQADINRFIRDAADGKTAAVEKTDKKHGKAIVEDGKGTAARTVGLLRGILSFAVSKGVIEANPARWAKRPADNHRARRLSADEYRRLGTALTEAGANAATLLVD